MTAVDAQYQVSVADGVRFGDPRRHTGHVSDPGVVAANISARSHQITGDLGPGFAETQDGDGHGRGHGACTTVGSVTGGVPWVWKDSIVLSPHACPLARSASVQLTGCQSGARTSRAPALHNSMRLPPGS